MRRFFAWLLLLAVLPVSARGEMYIRILARDDSFSAQMEKIRLRDALTPLLSENSRAMPGMLAEAGEKYGFRAEMRRWAPAGKGLKPTVQIRLGEGKGHNWWGVLFPDSLRLAQTGENETGEITFHYPIFTFLFGWLWGK